MRAARRAFVLFLILAAAAGADEIRLGNGDTLQGTILEENDDSIVFEHPILGRIELAKDQLAAPAPPGGPEGSGLFGTSLMTGWTRNIALGVSGSDGTSQELSVNTRLIADFEDENDRWGFGFAYFYSASDGDAETNKLFLRLDKDWLFPDSRWFWFARGRYDYDEFRDWDHRFSASGGVGYEIVQRESWDLLARLGVGGFRTVGGDETLAPEALLGLEAQWRIADGHTLDVATVAFPDLADLGEFRTLATLDWSVALGAVPGFSLKLGLIHEYESFADEAKSDLKYIAGLGYDF